MYLVNIANKIDRKCQSALRNWCSPELVRPTVLIQSDDWGRVGSPSLESITNLKNDGYRIGESAWDFYGLESDNDLYCLGDTLSRHVDMDGNPVCMTANFIMANADLRRMSKEGFTDFRFVPINEGFPVPWENVGILNSYRKLIASGVFYPALHGFTHFSQQAMLNAWHDGGEMGRRARALIQQDIPYLASLTPEYNFALMNKAGGMMRFLDEVSQRQWIDMGVKLFTKSFGFQPVSACAPGYRANQLTYRLWFEHGLKVAQTASGEVAYEEEGLLFIPRTVFFEPALAEKSMDVVKIALLQAVRAVEQGKMIVICSHSINYIEKNLGKRQESLDALDKLLKGLKIRFPNLRFANDGLVLDAWRKQDSSWFRPAKISTIAKRIFT